MVTRTVLWLAGLVAVAAAAWLVSDPIRAPARGAGEPVPAHPLWSVELPAGGGPGIADPARVAVGREGDRLLVAVGQQGRATLLWLDLEGRVHAGPLQVSSVLPPAVAGLTAAWLEPDGEGWRLVLADDRQIRPVLDLPPGARPDLLAASADRFLLAWHEGDFAGRIAAVGAAAGPLWSQGMDREVALQLAADGSLAAASTVRLDPSPLWLLHAWDAGGTAVGSLALPGPPGRVLLTRRASRNGALVVTLQHMPEGGPVLRAVALEPAPPAGGGSRVRWEVPAPGTIEGIRPFGGRWLALLARDSQGPALYRMGAATPFGPASPLIRRVAGLVPPVRFVDGADAVVIQAGRTLAAFGPDGGARWALRLEPFMESLAAWPDGVLALAPEALVMLAPPGR